MQQISCTDASSTYPKSNAFNDAKGAQDERKVAGYLERVTGGEGIELLQHLFTTSNIADVVPNEMLDQPCLHAR